jgi:hypothetical protein
MSRGSLPVAATPPKQIDEPRLSARGGQTLHDRERRVTGIPLKIMLKQTD